MKLINEIISLFNYYFKKSYTILFIEDVPEILNEKIIYVIGYCKSSWLIVFKCPCKCGENIYLNLLEEELPNWSFKMLKKKITISPSIRIIKGCESHFWIRNGRIIWCKDSY